MFTSLKKPFLSSSLKNSARVSGKGRKKRPAPRTNQIAGFGEFRPLTNLEKNKRLYFLPFIQGNIKDSCWLVRMSAIEEYYMSMDSILGYRIEPWEALETFVNQDRRGIGVN